MSKEEKKAKKAEKKALKKAEKERLQRLKLSPKGIVLYTILNVCAFAYLNEGFLTKEDILNVKAKLMRKKEA